MFIDEIILELQAGKGGDGAVSFLHQKYKEFGGPDGGDGGKGGSIYLIVDRNLQSLSNLNNKQIFKAENGNNGGNQRKFGKDGNDISIKLPLGTIVTDLDTGEILVDLDEDKQTYLCVKGGKGGKGNWNFKTSTNQAPRYAKPGREGQHRKVKLELKVIADIGLVGFPNAGKSSLLSVLTHANPKIANYPFSTLHPNLGTLSLNDYYTIIIADIPGLIEGAHKGLGLGIKFLKHIERTKMIMYLIDISEDDYLGKLDKLIIELDSYHKALSKKDYIILLTKIDMLDDEKIIDIKTQLNKLDIKDDIIFPISNLTTQGLDILKDYLVNKFIN